ncbi:hypothetical protein M427DRAFT_137599 [Gonapodya prolifera JEL478]|uniref:G-patch domain-containing protein n=1 Tax=Gonapodya prolifera (strain JEL478) TaxID=1344416 RepID=A0A139A5W4_GONPJ|nr:hypothetical protein M427DRAFT_137599 [Gonapodya prolifera JEL478]|eukprot:KXS12039.1 hypothetical protein M427DRAFT_137599 [Gonapodya prolifera JEL478]
MQNTRPPLESSVREPTQGFPTNTSFSGAFVDSPTFRRLQSYSRLQPSPPTEQRTLQKRPRYNGDDALSDSEEEFSLPIDQGTTGYIDWASIEASSMDQHIPEWNVGYKLVAKMGWQKGDSLGRTNQGIKEPIRIDVKEDPYGVGKKEELHTLLDASTAQRRLLESEAILNETDEQRESREVGGIQRSAEKTNMECVKTSKQRLAFLGWGFTAFALRGQPICHSFSIRLLRPIPSRIRFQI